jgi:SAM-dependent methyltransferase
LHIAPEPCLAQHLAGKPGIQYVTADRDPASGEVCLDITSMAFATDSFDVILCSHVLEHIPDDASALANLHRVLKPGGWAMLQVPLDDARACTFEDHRVIEPSDRERLFGQADHVRVYGRDYQDRLRAAGFQVHVDEFAYGLDARLITRYALLPEPIFVCRKPLLTA